LNYFFDAKNHVYVMSPAIRAQATSYRPHFSPSFWVAGMELRRNLTDGACADPVVFPKQRGLDITHCHQSGRDEEGMFLYRELEFKDAPGSVGSCRCGCTRANEGGRQGRPLSS
jgi:hypothetical protein